MFLRYVQYRYSRCCPCASTGRVDSHVPKNRNFDANAFSALRVQGSIQCHRQAIPAQHTIPYVPAGTSSAPRRADPHTSVTITRDRLCRRVAQVVPAYKPAWSRSSGSNGREQMHACEYQSGHGRSEGMRSCRACYMRLPPRCRPCYPHHFFLPALDLSDHI